MPGLLDSHERQLTFASGICKFDLTDEREGARRLTTEELLATLTAIGHPLRLRIIAELTRGRVHVSELARRLGMSRPLLYMHLDRLEKAGLVAGSLELSEEGRAMKYYRLIPFEIIVTPATVIDTLRNDKADSGDIGGADMNCMEEDGN